MEQIRLGDKVAETVNKELVVVVAGGDGTLSRIMHLVRTQWKENLPPVMPVPLGTGNDLARAMGWGGAVSTRELLDIPLRAREGSAAEVDAWEVWRLACDMCNGYLRTMNQSRNPENPQLANMRACPTKQVKVAESQWLHDATFT